MFTRLLWVIYASAKRHPVLSRLAGRVRPLVRRLLYPRGVEYGLFGRGSAQATAHLPNLRRRTDPELVSLVVGIGSFPAETTLPDLPPVKSPRFSVVINTLNRSASLATTLQALQYQTFSDFEVVVVVGPCTDDTLESLKAWDDLIRIGHCDEANLSKSRNIGIDLAAGEIVCFLDDDAIPEPRWLEELARVWTGSDWVGVGGVVRNHIGIAFQCRGLAISRLARQRDLSDAGTTALPQSPEAEETLSTTGCNASFRRDALVAIGGFDEAYVYFLDESDINLRLMNAGGRQTFAFNAEVHHKYAASDLRTPDHTPRNLWPAARSLAYFCARHGLARYGAEAVLERLEDFRHGYRRQMAGLIEQGRLNEAQRIKLEKDLREGLRAGLELARERSGVVAGGLKKDVARSFTTFRLRLSPARRLRVAFLSQENPYSGHNGIAVWTWTLASALARKGHEISIVSQSRDGVARVDFRDGVWIHEVVPALTPRPESPLEIPLHIWSASLASAVEVQRIEAMRGLDLVSGPIWDVETLALSGRVDARIVVSLHTTYRLAADHKPEWRSDPHRWKTMVAPMIAAETQVLDRAPVLLANSETVVENLKRHANLSFDDKIVNVLPHGVPDLSQTDFMPAPVQEGRRYAVFFGRHEARKGADLLLEAIPVILEQNPDFDLVLIGATDVPLLADGASFAEALARTQWPQSLRHRVHVLGIVERERMIGWLRAAEIVLLPSRFESFGLVYAEAASLARAIVAFDIKAAREVLGDAACLVEESPQALAQAVSRLAADKNARYDLQEKARQVYEQNYTVSAMTGAFEIFAAGLMGKGQAQGKENESTIA